MSQARRHRRHLPAAISCVLLLLAALAIPSPARADEPYARSRDYDLQNIRTHLWFDIEQRQVRGDVTESIMALRDNISALKFDSVGLTIESVSVDGRTARFSITPSDLVVALERPSARGEKHEILIHYHGQPKKGLYFILPDKNLSAAAQGNLDARRGGGHALLHPALRLPKRSHHIGNAGDRASRMDHDFEWPSRRSKRRSGRHEDVGLEAIRAAFDLL